MLQSGGLSADTNGVRTVRQGQHHTPLSLMLGGGGILGSYNLISGLKQVGFMRGNYIK